MVDYSDIKLWLERNSRYTFSSDSGARYISQEKLIQFDVNSFVDILGESTTNWIKRKSDTSITLDKDNSFRSQGTYICLLSNIYANPLNQEIYKFKNFNPNSLAICDSSHHTKEVMAWTYIKNNINDLGNYINFINRDKIQARKVFHFDEPAFVINTRWSSHNFYHWFHEAVPRLFTFITNITPNEMEKVHLIWLSNIKPSDYHYKTLLAMGIPEKK